MPKVFFENDDKKEEVKHEFKARDIIQYQLEKYLKVIKSNALVLNELNNVSLHITLDYCKEKLLIIKYVINEAESDFDDQLYQYRTPSERFEISDTLKQNLKEEQFEKIPYTNFQKLQRDVCFLVNSIITTCFELEDRGTYTSLMEVILGWAQEERDDEILVTCGKALNDSINELTKQLKDEKKFFLQEFQDVSAELEDIIRRLQDDYFFGKVEVKYATNWEDARIGQHDFKFQREKEALEETLGKYRTNLEYEERIHYEILNYVEDNISDLADQTEYWSEKYDTDIDKKDEEVSYMRYKCEELAQSYENLLALYNQRQQEIKEWNDIGLMDDIRFKAAITIQVWWRAVMERRGLGTFATDKPAEKGKKKKGKKGKKAKGKKSGKDKLDKIGKRKSTGKKGGASKLGKKSKKGKGK